MALSKKSPKGINQSDWNKIRTIYYLIDNDVIIRDPSMASYTDAPAYSSNKGKGAKEFIKHYHSMYSSLFKKGKAGARLEDYVSKQKGRLEIKAQLQKYQDEGLIDLPDFKMGVADQYADAASQLDLSGGIFDVLKGQKKDKFAMSAQALSDRVYPLALDQSAATYNKFAQGLAVDYADPDFPRTQYEDVASMTNAIEAGPARVLAANYFRDLRFDVSSLLSNLAAYGTRSSGEETSLISLQAQPVPSRLAGKVVDACNKAVGLIGIMFQYNKKSEDEKPEDSDFMKNTLSLPNAKDDTGMDLNQIISDAKSVSRDTNADGMITALTAINYLVNGKFKGSKESVWSETRPKMLQAQQESLLGLRQQIADRSLINLSSVARQLQDVMIKARTEHKNGGIDDKAYRNIEKTLTNIRKQADSLPNEGSLLNYLNDGDLSRVRDAKYRFEIIMKTLKNIGSQLDTAKRVSIQLKLKMQEGWTAAQVVAGLQQVYNLVSPVLTIRPQELTTGFGTSLVYNFVDNSGTKPTGGVSGTDANALKAPALARAKQAARSVQNALAQARRAGTERALQIYLYLTETKEGSDFKKNLKIAWYVSTQKTSENLSKVVEEQDKALANLNTPTHIRDRILHWYVPSAPYFLQNFMTLNPSGQKLANAATMISNNDKVKPYIGSDSMPRVPEDIVDPRKLLEMLPANIRAMSNDQAAARAKATTEYISGLFSKFTTVVNTQVNMMKAGGANYAEMQKSLERQIGLFADCLKEAKFDNSCKVKELPRHNAGLYYVGFTPKATDGSLKPTLAVMSPDDLLGFKIFKGDTFVEGDLRDGSYPMRGGPKDKTKAMLQERGGTSYIARRPITTAWGTTELINWSPLDAADLRNRFFCAMYCYDLRIKELNKRYQHYLNVERGIPTSLDESGTVLDDFGLVESADAKLKHKDKDNGGGNFFGGFNRW
jgi:hypothetical protein